MDGFVVAPGSQLVGPVFTYPDQIQGSHSVAVMVLDHDPLAVYDEYVAQARRLGALLPASGTLGPGGYGTCTAAVADRDEPIETADPNQARSVGCVGGGTFPGREGSVQLHTRWGGPSHHVMLEVYRLSATGNAGPQADPGAARAPLFVPLPKVSDRPSVSRTGAPFGGENNAFDSGYRRFRLEPGSRVVADVTGMFDQVVIVLRVDGNAEKVMAGYAKQLGRGGYQRPLVPDGSTPQVRHVKTRQGEVLMVENGPTGGGAASLITDPTGHWILIRASSD